MKPALLALSLLMTMGCSAFSSHVAPTSDLPVIASFTASPSSGKAPLAVSFRMDVTKAVKCEIVGIGAVPCVGTKDWSVTSSTDFLLQVRNAAGESVSQVTRVTITP